MTLIKAGSYAGAVAAIVTVLSMISSSLVWSKDLADMKREYSLQMYEMEVRQVNRSLTQWKTKTPRNRTEQQYIDSIVQQLQADQRHINDKIRKIQ